MTRWCAAIALGLVACPQGTPTQDDAQPHEPAAVEDAPAPEADAPAPDEVVVLATIQGMLVPLARTCAVMEGGEACDDDVPVGGAAGAADGSHAVLGEPTKVVCGVDGSQATAFPAMGELKAPVYFWPASGASRWAAPAEQPVDEALRTQALEALTEASFGFAFQVEQLQGAAVHQVIAVDLDGDGVEDPVYRVSMTPAHSDEPGNSVLYWGSELRPVSLRTHELNGRVDVLGALPTSHGTVLVIADDWMGGSGVHAFTVASGELQLLGEWSCGT